MKITFVTNGLCSGGSERVLSIIANGLYQRGYKIDIISLKQKDVFYKIEDGIRLLYAGDESRSDYLLKRIYWLHHYFQKEPPDLVIAFLNRVYCATIFSLIGLNIPIITSERNDPRYFKYYVKLLIRIFLPFSNHHVVQTQRIKSYFPRFIQKKTSIIVNPVNECVFEQKVVPKKKQIISVGRLQDQKNQKMMIDAFSRIANQYPDYSLVIYGEGPLRIKLQSQIDKLHLHDRIILPGRTKEIIEKLNESEIFCLSSNYEGMSNALIEALCLGLPIITTKVSGTEELIQNGVNGFLIDLNDTVSMSKTLSYLMNNPVLQEVISKNNKDKSKLFLVENIIDQWESIIKKIITKR